jgi:hypothetical protein
LTQNPKFFVTMVDDAKQLVRENAKPVVKFTTKSRIRLIDRFSGSVRDLHRGNCALKKF